MKLIIMLGLVATSFATSFATEPLDRAACTPCYNGYKICYDKVVVRCVRTPVNKHIN